MLNFIYYPVSGIMWVWHWLFDFITPNTPGGNGVAWALSVVFLVFTLRAILYKPFVKQIRTTKKMQEINPQLQAIRKKHAKDRVKMTEEMQKLQKEHGFNPLLGCLPMLLQIPVFIGLFHVLRSFNRTATGIGQLGMSPQETRGAANYFFSAEQVQNFLDARLFGVPLSAYITQPKAQWEAFVQVGSPIDFTRMNIAIVVIPMMIIASIATHMNSRASVARQPEAALENPQTRMMNMLALYVFPLGILVSGPFFPVAILLYWMSNNIWTYGQQHIVFGRIEKEEEEARQAKQEKLKANAPKPGARPDRAKKHPEVNGSAPIGDATATTPGDGSSGTAASESGGSESGGSDGAAAESTGPDTKHVVGNKPKAGQKPGQSSAGKSAAGSGPGSRKQGAGRGGGKRGGGRKGGRR